MDWWMAAIVGLLVFIVLVAIFKRYISALIYDYVIDCGLSFADNLLAGAGLIGLDIGDWIAAILIFFKERKISGTMVAAVVAWEATNFIPFSLIPVFGEGLEIVFNFFPAVTVSRIIANRFSQAQDKERSIETNIKIARDLGMDVRDEKDVLDRMRKLIDSEDPIDALSLAEKPDEEICAKLNDHIGNILSQTEALIANITSQEILAPQEMMMELGQGIVLGRQMLEQARSAAEQKDFRTATDSAMAANDAVVSAARHFEMTYNSYLQQLQRQAG